MELRIHAVTALVLTKKICYYSYMNITRNTMVSIDYDLTDDDGLLLDSSKEAGPLEYLHGYGMLIAGMEKALDGRSDGEDFVAAIPPADAYGNIQEDLLVEVPREHFPDDIEIQVGMEFDAGADGAPRIVYVKEVKDETIVIDANHPLAGKTLHFDVSVRTVREATDDELAAVLMPSCGVGCSCGPNMNPATCGGSCGCH